jgi:hypothetical protein
LEALIFLYDHNSNLTDSNQSLPAVDHRFRRISMPMRYSHPGSTAGCRARIQAIMTVRGAGASRNLWLNPRTIKE